jgi:hypothetical protein
VRLQRELDQAQAAPASNNFQKLDADRLQAVYHSYDNVPPADQASTSYSVDYAGSGHSTGSRPSSARRTSRQQAGSSTGLSIRAGAGSIGVRSGSSAARRTKELLQQAGMSSDAASAAGPSSPSSSHRSRPPSLGVQGQRPGSLKQWGQLAVAGSLLGGVGEQEGVPKARGLVRGSTDALHVSARPASRGF